MELSSVRQWNEMRITNAIGAVTEADKPQKSLRILIDIRILWLCFDDERLALQIRDSSLCLQKPLQFMARKDLCIIGRNLARHPRAFSEAKRTPLSPMSRHHELVCPFFFHHKADG